jgi:hypothetical protein
MIDYDLSELEENYAIIRSYLGKAEFLDEKIRVICKNRKKSLENAAGNPSSFHAQTQWVRRLTASLDLWDSSRDRPSYERARSYIQSIVTEMVDSFPNRPRPVVILTDDNHLFDFRANSGFDYIVECAYLRKNSLSECAAIGHEIGHCSCKEFVLDFKRTESMLSPIMTAVYKRKKKLSLELSHDSLFSWIYRWIHELVADVFAVTVLGPGIVARMIEDSMQLGMPMELGGSAYPPLNLRVQLMKKRVLKYARESAYVSDSFNFVEGWAPDQRNQMTTSKFLESALNDARYPRDKVQAIIESGGSSPIPNKLAFDRKVLRAMDDAIDSILEWGQVCPDFESLMYAREKRSHYKELSQTAYIFTFSRKNSETR